MPKFDFGGYATKNNLKCADGRTIRKDAFIDCDGMKVPLVWAHKHDDPGKVLGHAILENREDGVYTYGSFNETASGKNAKELVKHGDVRALSIYANNLVQKGGDVIHGMIREVSLCLAGANPGARIEELSFEHSYDEDCDDFEALLFNGENIVIEHSDDDEEEKKKEETEDDKDEKEASEEDKKEEPDMATDTEKKEELKHEDEETVKDVFDSMSEKQKNVVYFMIGQALENQDNEEEDKVSHNLFENNGSNDAALAHAEMQAAIETVIKEGPKYGSLRKSYEHHMLEGGALAHAIDTTGLTVPEVTNQQYANTVGYGINGLEYLFPEAHELNDLPEFVKRETTWVDAVLAGVKKYPWARIKTTFANITEDEARAKGYLKGNLKKEEFFSLMKRESSPTTVYKKQKFDRDDLIDLAKPAVVAWVKTEMRMMLNEELARAILIGDGRPVSSEDKIFEDKIRPIVSDVDFFTVKQYVAPGADDEETAKKAIKAIIKARKFYKGTGSPTFYTTEDWLTNMLLVEDSIGRRLYDTETQVSSAIRARSIVPCELLENYVDAQGHELIGILVNLNDYGVGTDKGGEVTMFDDFDIDYNQFKYLIETRCSGMLMKPYSAIAIFKSNSGSGTTTTD